MVRHEKVPGMRYSAAYPTGRELMLEPRYGCAGESFAFGGKPHEVRPEGPQGAARERIVFSRKERKGRKDLNHEIHEIHEKCFNRVEHVERVDD